MRAPSVLVLLSLLAAPVFAFAYPNEASYKKDADFASFMRSTSNSSSRYISSSTAVVSNNGYLCFASSSSAYSNTVCTSSTIYSDSSYSCAGTSGFYYYCSVYYSYSGASGSSNGRCYDTAYHAYMGTTCTSQSQIRTDTYYTGPCSGASYGAYIYYCPSSSYTSPSSSPPPPPPAGYSQSTSDSGLAGGALTCAGAILSQLGGTSVSSVYYNGGFELSDSTCEVCGDAKYCPVAYGSYTDLNPTLFDCVSGGSTDNGITYCTVTPSGGLIAIVVIIPLFVLSGLIIACCFCCKCCPVHKKRHPQTPVVVMQQPGLVAMNPMVMQPGMVAMNPMVMMAAQDPMKGTAAPAGASQV